MNRDCRIFSIDYREDKSMRGRKLGIIHGQTVRPGFWLWTLMCILTTKTTQGSELKNDILFGPVFIYEPPSFVDFSNSSGATVECSAHGQIQPTVQWVIQDTLIPVTNVSNLRLVLSNATLVFPPFKADHYQSDVHSAVYRCRASNPQGSIISRAVQVRAVVLHDFDVYVYDEYVIRGNSAVFKCQIPSFVADYVKVTSWLQDSVVDIRPGVKPESKYYVLPSGELYVFNVSRRDAMHSYQCKTKHLLSGKEKLSALTGRLIVTDTNGSVPPRITDRKTTVLAQQQEHVVLSCAAQGHPPPTYNWYRRTEADEIMKIASDSEIHRQEGLLVIERVRLDDAGVYLCVASNSLGSERTETSLTVTIPLSVHIEPSLLILEQGESATFKCVLSGFPITSVTWRKNSLLMHEGVSREERTLVVYNVSRQKTGMYQCFVSNGIDTAQSTAELRLKDSSPEIVEGFKEMFVHRGDSLFLKCIISGIPLPFVHWTVDDYNISATSDRIRNNQVSDGNGNIVAFLNFSQISVEDGGMYACTAENAAGRALHEAKIMVYGNPYIKPMRKVNAIAGEDLRMRCPVSGYPIEIIIWEKDGMRLPSNHRQKVTINGTITVRGLQPKTDAGRYTCIARNKQGQTAQKDVEVRVQVPPKIIPFAFQEDQTFEGVRASVFCSVSEGDLPMSIQWFKNKVRVHPNNEITIQTVDKYASILVILHVSEKHNGYYTCSASNSAAVVNHTAQLTVKVPPRWKVEPEDASALLGQNIQIACEAFGHPPPVMTWLKSSDFISGDFVEIERHSKSFQLMRDGTLWVNGVTKEDEGYYMCKAMNLVGSGLSKVIFLDVKNPVQFLVKTKNETVESGKNVKLKCEASGDSPIKITWYLGNDILSSHSNNRYLFQDFSSDSGMISVLLIASTERKDNGVFRCNARNPYGEDSMTVVLIVQELPEPPQDVKITESTSRSVTLTWTYPEDDSIPINSYIIQYTTNDDEWNLEVSNVSVSSIHTTMVINNLLPDTVYTFRILSKNDLGVSRPSQSVSISTDEEAPSGAPKDVKVEVLSSQSLRVTWKPPPNALHHGSIQGYNIGYRLYNLSDNYVYHMTSVEESKNMQVTLKNLRKYTTYGITVTAYNSRGKGPNTKEVLATTLEDVPSGFPSNIQCSPVSSQNIFLTWAPLQSDEVNGALQGYKILYRPLRQWYDSTNGWETKITTSLNTMLHGLEKFTNYTVHILAFTHAGDGVKSAPMYCSTLEDVPSSPADVKALTVSLDSILVSWEEPIFPNGVIIKYTIYVRSSDSEREEISKVSVKGNVHQYEAKSLGKNRRYEFWVTASTSIGEGMSTKIVSQETSGPSVPAGIVSFGKVFVVPWRSTVQLPCLHVGIPAPSIMWFYNLEPVRVNSKIVIQPDGILILREIDKGSSGNYTCSVQNNLNTENITHNVIVEVPPSPPSLRVVSSTATSVHLSWNLPDNFHAKLDHPSYFLSYRHDYGQWSEILLESGKNLYILDGLTCGTRYHFYITAQNNIGKGSSSDIITAKTSGVAPKPPPKEKFISTNATFITLHLDSWLDGGCPILYFVVEYKLRKNKSWMLVSNNLTPDNRRFVITDLVPGEAYQLRITAHNTAGSQNASYDFLTFNQKRSEVENRTHKEVTAPAEDEENNSFLNLVTIIPIISGLLIIFTIITVIGFCIGRRKPTIINMPEKVDLKYQSVSPNIVEPIQKKEFTAMTRIDDQNLHDEYVNYDENYSSYEMYDPEANYHLPINTNAPNSIHLRFSAMPSDSYCDRQMEDEYEHHYLPAEENESEAQPYQRNTYMPEMEQIQQHMDRRDLKPGDTNKIFGPQATSKNSRLNTIETSFTLSKESSGRFRDKRPAKSEKRLQHQESHNPNDRQPRRILKTY